MGSTRLADKRPEGLGHRKSTLLRYTFKSRGAHSWYAMCRAVTKEAWSEQGQVLKSPLVNNQFVKSVVKSVISVASESLANVSFKDCPV